jgi:hypothetical protein
MAARYKEYYNEMIKNNKDVFDAFKTVHDDYMQDEDKWKNQFNEIGKKVVDIIRDYEVRLCAHSEGGQYGKYANKLADKFWDEVRKEYPRIDFVGVK